MSNDTSVTLPCLVSPIVPQSSSVVGTPAEYALLCGGSLADAFRAEIGDEEEPPTVRSRAA